MGPTTAVGAILPATYPGTRMMPTPADDATSIPLGTATPAPFVPTPGCSPGWDGENLRSWWGKASPPVLAGDAVAPSPSSCPAAA